MGDSQWWNSWSVVLLLAALACGLCLILGMFLVKQSCRLTLKFTPSNRMALKAVAYGALASAPLGVFHSLPASHPIHAVAFVATFIIYSFVLGRIIKQPDGDPIGMRKGAVVTLAWGGMFVAVAFVVGTVATVAINNKSEIATKAVPLDLTYSYAESQKQRKGFDPSQAVPISDSTPNQEQKFLMGPEEQKRFEAAGEEIRRKYPLIDYLSPLKDQSAIDEVVATRDRLISLGLSPTEALHRAADKVVANRLEAELNRSAAARNASFR